MAATSSPTRQWSKMSDVEAHGHNLNVNEATDESDEDVEAHANSLQTDETVVEDEPDS